MIVTLSFNNYYQFCNSHLVDLLFVYFCSVSFRRFIYLPEYQVLLGIVTAILRYNYIFFNLGSVYAGTHYIQD